MEIKKYNGSPITFETKNGKVMVNATEMAKSFGKQPIDWQRTQAAKDFLFTFTKLKNCSLADLQIVIRGGNNAGTWFNEDVAMEFARWLSPEFAIWCNDQIKTLLTQGTVSLPQDYLSALKALVVSEEQKQTLALENAEMKPKAEYYDALCNREHLTNFRDTAKQLGVSQSDFIQLLLDNNYIYRDKHKHLKPYNQYTQKDNRLFKIKDFASSTSEHAGCQTLITIKGKQEFMKLLK